MTQPLSDQTIALVKATVPALEAHGLDIVNEMYSRMFQNPNIRDLFNQSHHGDAGSQPRALTGAILAYASNIENLGALAPAVERIAQKHVGLQILPEHYPHVAEALLGAIKAVLGDAATDEILAAWGEAYWFLANILIAREQRVTQNRRTRPADGMAGAIFASRTSCVRAASSIPSFCAPLMAGRHAAQARAISDLLA
jgi:nitric oxide dioxygenase